jgi:excisionase family DNA binding protein
MDEVPDGEYLRTVEVAAQLGGVNPKTVTRWAKAGKLPYMRTLGGQRRYPAAAIRELAATLGYQPADDPGDGSPLADDLPAGCLPPDLDGDPPPFGPPL